MLLLALVSSAIGKMRICGRVDRQRVKRGPKLRAWSAFHPHAMVTDEVCFPVYKPVDYASNSLLSCKVASHNRK